MPSIEATYDLTTAVGKTRFHVSDTNVAPGSYVWTDAELAYCLQLAGQVPELAAARALRAAAADAAKTSVVTRVGLITNDETGVAQALIAMADALEAADRGSVPPVT